MSDQVSKNFLVFGLTAAGKTTFAAALWHLLDSREVPTSLVKGKHSGNYSYLEKIAQRWCDGWKVRRTKSEEAEDVTINLLHQETGAEFSLEFRDIAGESLEAAFSTRYCDPDFVELVREANGMLLFVSADRVMDDVTILDALGEIDDDEDDEFDEDKDDEDDEGGEAVANELDAGPESSGPETVPALEPLKDPPYEAAKTPLQVRLVDLLQSLRLKPFNKKPFRIAIIVSAWDLSGEVSADVWLAKKMPLLNQFLRGSEIAEAARVYGVSAQGGVYAKKGDRDDESRKSILSIRPASKRISIVGHDAGTHDLTHPVRWLSGLEGRN